MASTPALDDLAHVFGQDLQLSATGDLARVNRATRTDQRVLRRLLTNPGGYMFHANYGAGLPAKVGENLDIAKLRALIRGQMFLEAAVVRVPEPVITLNPISGGVAAQVQYLALPDKQPVSLSFNVSV
jgi:hypothetical protein